MRIGVSIPNNWGLADVQDVVTAAELAEEAGFESVWASEHALNAGYVRERIGLNPYYDPLAVLAYVAARTTTIRLGTSVLVLPLHHPILLAKFVATVDQLAGGRFVLGVGAGSLREEFEALGVPYAERGAITDDTIGALAAIWTDTPTEYHGRYWNLESIAVTPPTAQQPHVPIWIGGNGAAARRRAATVCSGWQPTGLSVAEYADGVADIRRMAEGSGRDTEAITMAVRLNVAAGAGKLPGTIDQSFVVPGDSPSIISVISEFETAGASHVTLGINTDSLDEYRAMLRQIGDEVLPRFHAG